MSETKQQYESWVRVALSSPPWTQETHDRATAMLADCAHLSEIAEALDCSILTVQAELGIGRTRDVRAYRRVRGTR